jgi:tetratricopeptide (TPR) repeat protein
MIDKNSFGSILRRLREEKRKKYKDQWTVVALARRIGVSRPAYYAWENDESLPDTDNFKRIIAVFRPNEQDERALYRAVAQLPPEKQNLLQRNRLFTGRDDYLDELHRKLQEGGRVALTQAVGISGLGGIGKTQIALEYAYRYHPDVYRTVLWVNAANQATLQADYDAVAHLLELPERDEEAAERRVAAVKRWFDEHTRWLLIMDNADDLQLARSFMPERLLGHIILTTRSQAIRESNIAVQLVIDKMEPQEALIFLLRRAGLWDEESTRDDEAKLNTIAPDIRDNAAELVTLLGRLPLALDQAGAYIEASSILPADYIQLYQKERQNLLDTRGPPQKDTDDDHSDTVTVTVQLCYRKACERHEKAADVLCFCSYLHPDDMPEKLFYQDSGMQLTLRSFNDVMTALRRYSLIARNAQEKTLSMHRLVQDVLLDTIPSDLQDKWAERAVQALHAMYPPIVEITDSSLSLICEVLNYFDEGSGGQPEPFIERAVSDLKEGIVTENPDTAKSISVLALLYQGQGEYWQAEHLYKQALTILKNHSGAEHPDAALPLYGWAILLHQQGKLEQAEALYQRAVCIQEQCLGASHPRIQSTKRNYANFLHAVGLDPLAAAVEMNDKPLD